jgi:hypothetical protein
MKSLGLSQYALCSCVAAAMLAGCGGSQPPIGAPGAMPQGRTIATHADSGSWMLPEAASEDLLYVDSDEDVPSAVWVYSYPQGKLVGKLKGFIAASGECADKQGNVYITDGAALYAYAHAGTKRIKTLKDPPGAFSCSVDPVTGNLAAAGGGVAIFKNAKGKPTHYRNSSFYEYWFCGYDNKGNLFVDGLDHPGTGHFIIAELAKGGNSLRTIALNQYIGWPSNVQWHYKYLAVGDAFGTIYQFNMKGYRGIRVGATRLDGNGSDLFQFWIEGNTVIAPYACTKCDWGSQLHFYRYPSGSKLGKGLPPRDHPAGSFGAVVSLAPG